MFLNLNVIDSVEDPSRLIFLPELLLMHTQLSLNLPECVVDSPADNVDDVKASECKEQLMEHVPELGSGEHDKSDQVAHEANDPDHRDQNAVKPKSEKQERDFSNS